MSVRGRLIIFLVTVFGVILLFVWLFSKLSPSTTAKTGSKAPIVLTNYIDKNSAVEFTIDGPVNSEELHRSIRITVGPGNREMDVIQGYQNTIINSKAYSNNQTAYDVFLRSLSIANFTKLNKSRITDDRGVCPLGDRDIYRLLNNDAQLLRSWTSTCGVGTTGSSSAVINNLFEQQIPDFNTLIRGVNLPL